MRRLGYERYGAQGGDFGAGISIALGAVAPEHVIGRSRMPASNCPQRMRPGWTRSGT